MLVVVVFCTGYICRSGHALESGLRSGKGEAKSKKDRKLKNNSRRSMSGQDWIALDAKKNHEVEKKKFDENKCSGKKNRKEARNFKARKMELGHECDY